MSLWRTLWPDLNSSRALFTLAIGAVGLGCVTASCFGLLLTSGPEPQWESALTTGGCLQDVALFLAAGLMMPATIRERRSAPRAFAWATLSVAALFGTVLMLATMSNQPDSLALCSVLCAPLVLGPAALALYFGLKARGDLLPVPPYALQSPPPVIFPPARGDPLPTGSEADLPARWHSRLEQLKSQTTGVASDVDLPDWLQTAKPDESGTPKPAASASLSAEAQASMDELSQILASSRQLLDETLQYPTIDIPSTPAVDKPSASTTDLKQKQCPSCGTKLDVPKGSGYVFCYQCGSQVNF